MPRVKPHRKGEQPQYTAEEQAQWDAYNASQEALRIQQQQQAEEKAKKRIKAAERFNRAAGVVMEAMSQQSNETPFTGLEYQQASEAQRQDKVQAFHDTAEELSLGLKSAATATGIMGGFGALGSQLGFGILGGEGVDVTTQGLTPYRSWSEMVSAKTGMPEWAAGLTNPGYFLPYGRLGRFISNSAGRTADRNFGQVFQEGTPAAEWAKSAKPAFKSELDWTPESWFGTRATGAYDAEDVAALQSHLPEYLKIEQEAKTNGTWLKMPDGSTWEGDPRSWVQLMSKDGQKLAKERWFSATRSRERTLAYPEWDGESWGSNSQIMADKWTGTAYDNNYGGEVFEVTYPLNAKIYRVDAQGYPWSKFPHPDPRKHGAFTDTNTIWDYADSRGWGNVTKIDNVVEGLGDLVNDVVIHPTVPRKSLLGNNGNFDFSSKNIYKGLLPFMGLSSVYGLSNN